ncbi:conserved hypothetical protein [Tenacibaculum litoreum]|uniref:hypothetical protein n=1 Tax=Tenacibaculum litoreum TaxID=321269 RepID=UPI0038961E9F
MNKLITIILSIVLFGCNKQASKQKNKLIKSVNKTIEYTIQVNNGIQDTLLITTKKFGKNDQIIYQKRETSFDNQNMKIDYIYNSDNQLKKEIVKMSTDSLPLEVNYSYKNSLLFQSSSILDKNNEKFEQIETQYYRKDKTKKMSSMSQIYVNKISKDTITNSLVNAYYNKDEINDSIVIINLKRQGLKTKTIYQYNGSEMILAKEFNNNSLVSSTKFEYKMDEFDNWIEKRIIENEVLRTIAIREIYYK